MDVAKQRLRRMGLLGPVAKGPVAVVRDHLAMQGQDFGPAKWSIGQRLKGFADADIERKISDGLLLRTHVLRPTWHLVARSDLRWLMALSGPRVQKGVESRYRELGLDAKTRARAERVITKHLADGHHLTRKELADVLRSSRIDDDGQRLPYLLAHCELEGVICSGRVRGKHQTYALFDERVPQGSRFDRDSAVTEVVRRYLKSHGPATVKDMAWWSGLTMTDLRNGLADAGATSEERDGLTLWSIGTAPRGGTRRARVQLLQNYDELVVGYTESRYFGDPRAETMKARFHARDLPGATVMLGSRAVGHWRRPMKGKAVEVEVLLYEKLRGSDASALEEAAAELGRFIGRETRLRVEILGE